MDTENGGAAPALALVAESALRAEVRRVAAAAQRPLTEQSPPVGRHAWSAAPLVVLDTAAATSCAEAGHPRRVGVVLVTAGEPELPDWRAAAAVGAERVVALPGAAVELVQKFAEHAEPGEGDGVVVAIAGAVGGAGASTLAAATALRAAALEFRGHTVLVDGAPHGGGLDLLLGIETAAGPRWSDLTIEDGRVAAAALHSALPSAAPGLAVLSCDRPAAGKLPAPIGPAAGHAVVEAGRAAGDLVICDISGERGPHAEQMLDAADLVVLVVPARLRALAAAGAVATTIRRRNPNQGLVIRGPAPGNLRGTEIAAALDLPLLAAVRAEPGLARRLERGGLGIGRRTPLTRAADAILAVLGERSGR